MVVATGPERTVEAPICQPTAKLFHFGNQRVQSQCVLMTFSHHQHSRPITLQDFAVAVWPHPLHSGSVHQRGPALVPLVCVDVQRTLFVDCSVGGEHNEADLESKKIDSTLLSKGTHLRPPMSSSSWLELTAGGSKFHRDWDSKRPTCVNLEREKRMRDGWLVLDLCGNGHSDPDGVVRFTIWGFHFR